MTMDDNIKKIQAAVANGLNKNETEALIGHKLDEQEVAEFNRTKALLKLQAKKEKVDAQKRKKANQDTAINTRSEVLKPSVASRYTEDEVLAVVDRTHGLTSSICAALDCSNQQWQVYLRTRPNIKAAQLEARQGMLDLAEKRLLENLNSDDDQLAQRAVEFILKHLGASRGWNDLHPLQQINVDRDGTVTIQQIFGIGESDGE